MTTKTNTKVTNIPIQQPKIISPSELPGKQKLPATNKNTVSQKLPATNTSTVSQKLPATNKNTVSQKRGVLGYGKENDETPSGAVTRAAYNKRRKI